MKRILPLLSVLISGLGIATAQPVVIPVVFHILHQGGPENISDQQVLSEMQVLNADYNMTGVDTSIAEPFRNNVADMGIEFRLANTDPQGNCTNGIQHIYNTATSVGGDNTKWPLWPPDKYLNIWVVSEIDAGGPVAAYTYYPWIADTLRQFDGTIIVYPYVGTIGSGTVFTESALTYETGKYFGLLPMCGDEFNTCGDDSVSDTPPCEEGYECEPDSSCGEVDNYQNFMGGLFCSLMFTNGQKARVMQYLNRGAAGRNNLWTANNLRATGTADSTPSPCAPVCDFIVSNLFECLGDAVTFTDISYNGSETARTWSFSNSNVITSSDSSVLVTYNTTGWQTATLSVMNAQGSSQKTKTLVYVADPNAVPISTPYYTGFNDTADFNQNWVSVNPDKDAPHFQEINGNGLSAVLLNNYDADSIYGMYDELISPLFDCSDLSRDSAQLSFRYSLASRDAPYGNYGDVDSLVVCLANGCTDVWENLYTINSSNFFNAGNTDSYFNPGNNNSLWTKVVINLSSAIVYHYLQSPVRFKIRVFGSEHSNNFYLTDFVIGYATTAIMEERLNAITIQPNPFNNYVSISGLPGGKNEFNVYDLQGRLLMDETITGNNGNVNVNLSAITPSGIYFIKITGPQGSNTFKLVKD